MRFLAALAVLVFPLTVHSDSPAKPPVDLKSIAETSRSAKPKPTQVVSFKKLLSFLPPVPEGWTAEKPGGSVTDLGKGLRLSEATRTYIKGEDQSAAVTKVTIIDAGGRKEYFAMITAKWKGAQTEDGYDKVVEIDGMPGFEHFSKAIHGGSLSVFVANRFFVQVDISNQDLRALREWLQKIDLKKLAVLR